MTGNRKCITMGLAAACLLAGGCGAQPSVFDKPAIDGVHKLMVVPLNSVQDPCVGPVVSGELAMRLAADRLPKLLVVEAPVLWRLRSSPPAATSQPGTAPVAAALVAGAALPLSFSDDAALKLARQADADAVLVGSATYAIPEPTAGNMPGAMAGAMKGGAEYQKNFAVRMGTVTVETRVLSTATGRPIYVHTGAKTGLCSFAVIKAAAEVAVKPLEDYVRSSR